MKSDGGLRTRRGSNGETLCDSGTVEVGLGERSAVGKGLCESVGEGLSESVGEGLSESVAKGLSESVAKAVCEWVGKGQSEGEAVGDGWQLYGVRCRPVSRQPWISQVPIRSPSRWGTY
jgi:hypothetical protein